MAGDAGWDDRYKKEKRRTLLVFFLFSSKELDEVNMVGIFGGVGGGWLGVWGGGLHKNVFQNYGNEWG